MPATNVIASFKTAGLKIAVAESLSGGGLASELVSVAGASEVFLGSIVAYQTELKASLLGVPTALLQSVGAVDSQVALAMATGVRAKLAAGMSLEASQIVAVSTTGVAGPDRQDGQPVGLVFIAMDADSGSTVRQFQFSGDRAAIRSQTIAAAIVLLEEHIAKVSGSSQ